MAQVQPQKSGEVLVIQDLPSLPDDVGFGGMYAGVSNGALIVCGGANYPELSFQDGGSKEWYDTIYILERPNGKWSIAKEKLPSKMAYGVSVTYENAVVCAGGDDGKTGLSQVFKLEYSKGAVKRTDLPSLPEGCTYCCGALVGSTLFIAGGIRSPDATSAMKNFWALDLSQPLADMKWVNLDPWPGPARWTAVAGSQDGSFFLFSGMELESDESGQQRLPKPYLSDAYCFTPGTGNSPGTWREIAKMPRGSAGAPSPALPLGQSHVAILGGTDGLTSSDEPNSPPSFLRDVYVYHTVTNTWSQRGELPQTSPCVTVPTTWWHNGWVMPSGESAPGKRSPKVYFATQAARRTYFTAWDWTALICYFGLNLAIGFYCASPDMGSEDYLIGGQRVPGWAAGISIFGTQLSALTYMAIPAVVYATDWVRIIGVLTYLPASLIAIYAFLPFFRRLNVTSAYEYLGKRFGMSVRLCGSGIFILSQLLRVAVILYLPALALAASTGMNVYLAIIVMGFVAVFYTAVGGIEAVIWTDIVQVVVLMVGALLCLGYAIVDSGGITEIIHVANDDQKFQILHWGWDATEMVVWVMLVGTFFGVLSGYNSDQSVVQRYLTTPSEKQAAHGIWVSTLVAFVTVPIFYALGTVLYVYYKNNPHMLDPGHNDELVPFFVVQQLPIGIAGLVVAGIFAAAMSSLDSAMHSAATAYVVDFHRLIKKDMEDRSKVFIARVVTCLVGLFGTVTAMWLVTGEVTSIFDMFTMLAGLLTGSLGGVFLLAIFTRRTTALGALVGTIVGAITPWIMSRTTDVNIYLYSAIGALSCVAAGYLTSFILPSRKVDLTGLTIFDMLPLQEQVPDALPNQLGTAKPPYDAIGINA